MNDPGDEHRPSDIALRLRSLSNGLVPRTESGVMREAADEIERLRAANAWVTRLLQQQSERCAELHKVASLCRNALPAHIEKILYEGSG